MVWQKVSDKLPTTKLGEQVDVYFVSPGWATGIRGMFTYYGEEISKKCSTSEYEWAEYDQQNDKFYTWEHEEPTYYFIIPDMPKDTEFTNFYDDDGEPIFVGDRLSSEDGFEVIVVKDENDGTYSGKLLTTDKEHSCANVPYALNRGKGYTKDVQKMYVVYVYDKDKKLTDVRITKAWYRKEAYLGVMNEMKPHITWDADKLGKSQNWLANVGERTTLLLQGMGRVVLDKKPRWAHVKELFICGSTTARILCRLCNVDPDEEIGLEPCSECEYIEETEDI